MATSLSISRNELAKRSRRAMFSRAWRKLTTPRG
jgi:hypothetical protein